MQRRAAGCGVNGRGVGGADHSGGAAESHGISDECEMQAYAARWHDTHWPTSYDAICFATTAQTTDRRAQTAAQPIPPRSLTRSQQRIHLHLDVHSHPSALIMGKQNVPIKARKAGGGGAPQKHTPSAGGRKHGGIGGATTATRDLHPHSAVCRLPVQTQRKRVNKRLATAHSVSSSLTLLSVCPVPAVLCPQPPMRSTI